MFTFNKKSTARKTPSSSTPLICKSLLLCEPIAMKTDLNPCRFRSLIVKSRPIAELSLSSTPRLKIALISRRISSRGSRYSGMPSVSIPPATDCASKTVTSYPNKARSWAHDRPAGPAPITATLIPFLFNDLPKTSFNFSRSTMLSTPNRSVANRLSARIAIGSSIVPRRQEVSHGAAQTRPQIDANGFGLRATWYASRYRPSSINPTYRPASVWTGHAAIQGKLESSHSRSTNLSCSATT